MFCELLQLNIQLTHICNKMCVSGLSVCSNVFLKQIILTLTVCHRRQLTAIREEL